MGYIFDALNRSGPPIPEPNRSDESAQEQAPEVTPEATPELTPVDEAAVAGQSMDVEAEVSAPELQADLQAESAPTQEPVSELPEQPVAEQAAPVSDPWPDEVKPIEEEPMSLGQAIDHLEQTVTSEISTTDQESVAAQALQREATAMRFSAAQSEEMADIKPIHDGPPLPLNVPDCPMGAPDDDPANWPIKTNRIFEFDEEAIKILDDRIVMVTDPGCQSAEEYRAVRTSLLARWQNKRNLVHTITSATPQEGKTITSINLGMSLAEFRNRKTIMIEADLRLPAYDKLLHLGKGPGLIAYLRGDATLEQCTLRMSNHGPFVIPAGDRAYDDAVTLLSSARMQTLVEQLRQKFDHVIIDTPPVIELADAGVLGSISDDVLLIARMHRTPKRLVEQAIRTLRSYNANVGGLIATDQHSTFGGYYGYRYGYKYGGRYRYRYAYHRHRNKKAA